MQVLKKESLPKIIEEQIDEITSCLEEGDFEDIIDILDELYQEYPENYQINLLRIKAYKMLGIYSEDILPLLEKCHAADPTDLHVWGLLIEELAESGFVGLAEKEIELLATSTDKIGKEICHPDFIKEVKESAQYEKKELFGDSPEASRLHILYNLADKNLYFKNFEDAHELATELIKRASDSPFSWILIARYYFQVADLPEAIKAAKKAIELNPFIGEAYYILTFSELILGQKISRYEAFGENLADYGVSYQAYHLILSDQNDALINLAEKFRDEISGHPDAMRFFECLAFVNYMKGKKEESFANLNHANTLSPVENSPIADTHIQSIESNSEDPDVPFILMGHNEFPYFWSKRLDDIINASSEDAENSLLSTDFTNEERQLIPNLFDITLNYCDAFMVKLSLSLVMHCSLKNEERKKIFDSLYKFSSGTRLSAALRSEVTYILTSSEEKSPEYIIYKNKKIPNMLNRIDFNQIPSFKKGSTEEMCFNVLQESIEDLSLADIEEICKAAYESNPSSEYFAVEYARYLHTLGKFDKVEQIFESIESEESNSNLFKMLKAETSLPNSVSDAKELLHSMENKTSYSPQEFREFKLLSAEVNLLEDKVEEAILDLDTLRLSLPTSIHLVEQKKSFSTPSKQLKKGGMAN